MSGEMTDSCGMGRPLRAANSARPSDEILGRRVNAGGPRVGHKSWTIDGSWILLRIVRGACGAAERDTMTLSNEPKSNEPELNEPAARVVDIQGLSLVFETADGPVHALSEVDLAIQAGEFVSFIGPS